MYKTIIFDFDGTLVDSKYIFVEVYNEIARRYGYLSLDSENIHELRKLSIRERFKIMRIPLYHIPWISFLFLRKYGRAMHRLECFEGIKALLNQLQNQGFTLAIISSNAKSNIQNFLQSNQITAIQHIYTSRNLFGKHKVMNRLMKDLRVTPKEILYVGDELRDITACRAAQISIAWVSWGYDPMELINQNPPDYYVNSTDELLALLTHPPL
ncbi:HAD-IA family hydrolase [Siphonobacter sp. SORGH_AS_0500]|uniref:HAD-IA family hydrolase n=1 Tax=Siphonobacter sp. SORGH_AS_0500 TaxID=1864824 RepID=UPI000CB90D5C|nr:HAD-IA family hydrolase [Siphonobacter sp. SORGH_AS_0500]MDR6195782.1 phosphoglycolate phosphatase [Siphonobacter sp. SORGH_AS_0500]PKK37485.1 hypothetical protein BWI96_06360 [Siphonobacter sp. SORGH_AS_0500]